MEQSPEWRYALHVRPIAAMVAAERIRCMRCFALRVELRSCHGAAQLRENVVSGRSAR